MKQEAALTQFEVLVPAKRLSAAKTRLRETLSVEARSLLVRDMLANVLRAVGDASLVGRVHVVTGDLELAQLARDHGAEVLPDAGHGLNAALATAVHTLAARPSQALAIVQGDLPWLTAEAIDGFLAPLDRPGLAAIVPDQHRTGTGALAWHGPPGMKRFAFGVDSAMLHVTLAREAGLDITVCDHVRFFRDVDDPRDMAELARVPTPLV